MFSATGLRAAGVLEHVPHQPNDAARRRQSARRASHRRPSAYLSGRPSLRDSAGDSDGITIDRLTYLSTALDALPGIALREYFVPIVRLKKQLLLRQRSVRQRFPSRATADGAAAYAKLVETAMGQLTKALNTAAGDLMLDGGTSNLTLEVRDVMAHLKDKLTPVCFEAGGVFAFPREPPEASFVYIIVAGTVSANYFQPQSQAAVQQQQQQQQQRRGGGGGGGGGGVPAGMRKERQMYFTSAKEVVRLCGGGLPPEAAAHMDDYAATDSVNNNSAGSPHAGDGGATSMSGVTTAIQRSLRRASRTVGQPTLQPMRSETVRAPAVLGATEAFGLLPSKYVCYTASSTSVAGTKGVRVDGATAAAGATGATYVEFVDAFRLRTLDVHAALVRIAAQQQAERQQRTPYRVVPWCATVPGEVIPRGVTRTVADFIVAARRRALYSDYAATELLMRQSWLLQDAPAHTIRTLISHLVPRTYMPGEVMACPHTPGSERQLCFLRRGRFHVFAVPRAVVTTPAPLTLGEPAGGHGGSRVPARESCTCWRVDDAPAEVVDSGASFGELSVLFHEPRHCLLRADTVCDVWCLPHRSFTALMQRDSALREGLLQKAAVLRIEWMGEQRYTRALAQQLRACSELLHPLSDMAIRLIQERLEPVVHPPGSLVASTSTRCTEMTFIMRGTVSTICDGVATYTAGDVLGEGCLVPHRWPLGLAARTMVEGWRIRLDQLLDALRRMDVLHQYSGIVTSQTPQLMKRIFGTPQPEIEVDAVGRQRMPTVGPPPGGFESYLAYGRAVSEVQLRALCFLYGDYVRWEDINYASMDFGPSRHDAPAARSAAGGGPRPTLDSVARGLAVSRLNGRQTQSVSAALGELQPHLRRGKKHSSGAESFAVRPRAPSATAAGGSESAADLLLSGAAAAGSGRSAARVRSAQSGRRGGATAAAARAGGYRAGSSHGPALRVSNAGAFLVKDAFLGDGAVPVRGGKARGRRAPGTHTAAAVATRADLPAGSNATAPTLLPRLQRMKRLLEERNRTWAAEQRHEAALAQQETNQRDAAVRDQAMLRSTAAIAHAAPSSRLAKAAAAVAGTLAATGAARGGAAADLSPAPVHIFLLAEKPKYELTLNEAIAIGYVMQLPDIAHIQHSVSLVDPDVALGPPTQRARRHLMAVTPNDRYTKHNFLFAAAALEDGSSTESLQKAAEAQAEATVRSKTRKLYTMMRTAVAAHMDEQAAAAHATVYNPTPFGGGGGGGSGDFTPPRGSVALGGHAARPAADTLVLTDELHPRSPEREAGTRDTSLSAAAFTPPPERPGPHGYAGVGGGASAAVPAAAAARGDSMATLSPLGGSPAMSAAQRKEEAFQRMLQRDPVQAVDLLRRHYEVPWTSATTSVAGLGPMSSLSTPTRRGADMRSSAAGSVHASSSVSTMAEPTQPQHRRGGGHGQRLSLLRRLEGAVGGAYGGEVSSRSVAATPPPALSRSVSAGAAEVAGRRGSETDTEAGSQVMAASAGAAAMAAVFPQLVRAAARDRWHGANQLSLHSAPPPSTPSHAATVTSASPPRSPRAEAANVNAAPVSPSSAAAAASAALTTHVLGSSGLVEYFYRGGTAPALFVEGYGPLQPLPDELTEYPPTLHATAGGGGGGSSEPGGGSASRFARAATSVVAAAVLRRSASRPGGLHGAHFGGDGLGAGQRHSPFGGRGASAAGAGGGAGVGAAGGGGRGGPHVEVFVMPDHDDTEVLIRRIQRDVNALNAVAKEQRRERAGARGGRGGAHASRLLEAALGQPNADELDLLEVWRQHYRHVANEGLRRASLPVALRGEAGPDYMKQELEYLAYAPAPMDDSIWRYTAGVQEWQEQQQQAARVDGGSLVSGQFGTLTGGGGGASALAGAGPDGPRRVVAAVGAATLGFPPVPLQSPSALLAPAAYDAWVQQREDFFSAYKRLLGGDAARGGRLAQPTSAAGAGAATAASGAAAPLTAPALRFTPALAAASRRRSHSPPSAAGESPAPPSERFAGPAVDFRTGMDPRSEDSETFEGYVRASAGAHTSVPRFGTLSTPGTETSSAVPSTPERATAPLPPATGAIPQVVLGATGPTAITSFADGAGVVAGTEAHAAPNAADDTQPWGEI